MAVNLRPTLRGGEAALWCTVTVLVECVLTANLVRSSSLQVSYSAPIFFTFQNPGQRVEVLLHKNYYLKSSVSKLSFHGSISLEL